MVILIDYYKGNHTMIDYSPLWKTMNEKKITKYILVNSGIDRKTLDYLRKNKNITLLTVEKICNILDCKPNDIVQFTKPPSSESEKEKKK